MGNIFKFIVVAIALLTAQSASAQYISYSVARQSYGEDPAVNNYLSARYDYLLQTNLRFRSYRMWKECRTINFSPELHAGCIGSFDKFEPILPGAR